MKFHIVLTFVGLGCVLLFTSNQIFQKFRFNHAFELIQAQKHLANHPQKDAATFQILGEDKDWNVRGWSKKHLKAVSADTVDKPSVANIWHSRSEAWSGIDKIFPTGNDGYSYQTNHFLNANEAKLLNYMKMVKTTLKGFEKNLPKSPKNLHYESGEKFNQESKEVKDIIDTQRKEFSHVIAQTRKETTVQDKAHPTMLNQLHDASIKGTKLGLQPVDGPPEQPPPAPPSEPEESTSIGLNQPLDHPNQRVPSATVATAAAPKIQKEIAHPDSRVFSDEAVFGEGIAGDIRRMSKAGRGWDSDTAARDMDSFFDHLPVSSHSKPVS